MAFLQDTEDRQRAQRLYQAVGQLVFTDGTGSDVGFSVSNRDGQITVDARPAAPAFTPVANIGGFQLTWPVALLIGGVVALLVLRK